jgi:hypothetical protein
VDVYKRAGKATASSKTADIVSQYGALDSSEKLLCIRIGYAWMFPKEEDVTHRTFTAGIKYFLVAPRGKLTSGLKVPRSSVDFLDAATGGAFVKPNILVPRKRPSSRGEEQVQVSLSLPSTTPHKPKKKARCLTPMNLDLTEPTSDSKFQDILLEEGCGSQVTIP